MRRTRALTALSAMLCLMLSACDGDSGDDDAGSSPADSGGADVDGARPPSDSSVPPVDDAGPPPDGVPTLVAIGKFGRVSTSCDSGQTWAHDRSDDDSASCAGIDCDHHRGSSTGLTWGGGYFWASFGWGAPAMRIMRSRDGVDWQTQYDSADLHFAGLAWAGDRLVGATSAPGYSTDGGVSFEEAEWPMWDVPEGQWPVGRQIGYAPVDGGRIIAVASDGAAEWGAVVWSRDGGRTFSPATVDSECRGRSRPPTFGGSAWVLPWADRGVVCTSVDGGETWTASSIAEGADLSPAVYTGSEHVIWAGTRVFRSPDGLTWTESSADAEIGAVGYEPTSRTFVAVRQNRSYGEQRFLRSSDGERWEELSASAAVRGHPITHIGFGYGAADGACAP